MKLSTKLHLYSMTILIVMTLSVLLAGIVTINKLAREHHEQIMRTQLGQISERIVDTLNNLGIEAAVRETKRLQTKLTQGIPELQSLHIYIIEEPDRVIYHPNHQMGDRIERSVLNSQPGKRDGSLEYRVAGEDHFAVYTTIKPLDWTFFISLNEDEVYPEEGEYLRNIILISVAIFLLSALFVNLFVRRFAQRLQTTLDHIKHIQNGDLDSRIPITVHDEVGHLQAGINTMSSSILARTIKQQEAEAELRKSEARFRDLVQKVHAAVVVYGSDKHILTVNSMAQDLLGLSEDQLLGKSADDPLWHFLREDGSAMPQEEYPVNRVLATHHVVQNMVIGFRLPDREEPLWALVNAIPVTDETNGITQVVVSFTDITERKKSEQQLSASEQLFRTLVENSPDHISRYDTELRRIYINPTLQKLFSAPEDQIIGKTSMVASPLIDPGRYMANLRKVIDSGQEVADEIAYNSPQGELCWASSRFAPEFDVEGKIKSVLVISNDITEQKQAEQERQEYTYFLESLDRVTKILSAENDIEALMRLFLDEVLNIFDCDRAYLQYPCDPDAIDEWWIPMESCVPEYPTPLTAGRKLPYHPHIVETLRAIVKSDTAVKLGPNTDHPIPPEITEKLGVRSLLAIALRPKVDRPWQFAIHQCSSDRTWTDQEVRLFEEISHRLSDGLNDLLVTRNLTESEERFRLVYENSPVPIWEEDFSVVKTRLNELSEIHGSGLEAYLKAHPEVVKACAALVKILNVNNAALELHEADSKQMLYDGLPKTFIAESYQAFRNELIAISKGETEIQFDGVVQTLSGKRREVSLSFSVCPGYEKNLNKVFVSLFDITQRKQDEEQLRLAASVFSTSQEGIMISDASNRVIDTNPAFTHLTGYSREEALGRNPSFLSAGRQPPEFYVEMWKSLNTKGEWQGELWNKRKSGEVYPELLSIVAVKDKEGQLQHYVGAFSDISMIKQHEADLDHIAHYDMLTSVPNRRLLSDRMEQAIAHTIRHGWNLAVCYLDLDGFKPINDQYGHEYGDLMLIEIANRLQNMSRGEDTVARLGGDEFVLLWNDIGSQANCMHALERIMNKLSEPMTLKGETLTVSASIGVTIYPDDNVDADSLLRHADHAMYTAKQLGKNRYQIFDARLEREILAQSELLTKVERGLAENQFVLHYQPKIDFTTGEVVGVEALLRWADPVLGLIHPNEFLSLIESDSLALKVGRWVIGEAIRQAKQWDDQGICLSISINIFPRHLKSQTFIKDLHQAIARHWPELPGHRLLLEIVETSDLEELEPIDEVINECLKIGIGFSLDDFGTGYSSLVYLRRLSIEELKIDQSFVRDMLIDPDDAAIVVGVISLGNAFNLRVVAEGVENNQQAKYLVNLGCNIVQGYGMGRPMATNDFEQWYNDHPHYKR